MPASPEKESEILGRLHDGVVNFDQAVVVQASHEALQEDVGAYKAAMDGLAAGMHTVGKLFEDGEYFVPETLMSADALYKGLAILRPHIKPEDLEGKAKGEVVIGVVEGDVHDIGKNLVKMMFEVAGFNVHDLGRNVPLEQFVEEQVRSDAELVCLSTMMTTTLRSMQRTIESLRARNPNCKIMIGGAPVSYKVVDEFAADATAPNATNALREAIKLVDTLRTI
ncbi:MAG: cobalamin-dependent protein [Chloroflexi bacterium]|nr:cobalamin-dependent protein [Chloroflexota bacterium]